MKIDTKAILKELNGKPSASKSTVGEAIGIILNNTPSQGRMKLYKMAKEFTTKDSVEVTAADVALIRQATEVTKAYATNLVPGQILEILDELEAIKLAPKKKGAK